MPASRSHTKPTSSPSRAQRRQRSATCCCQASAFGLSPWCTCSATTRTPSGAAARTVACSRAIESRPPLHATATHARARAAPPAPRSARRRVAVAPVGLEPLVAAVEKLAQREVRHLPQCIVQRTLQEGGHLLRVAVRAADRLVDDLV